MKKNSIVLAIMLTFVIILSGCGKKEPKDDRTLDDFIKAYTDNKVEVDKKEKPIFSMIGAIDGVIFYMDNNPVKIYEFKSPGALEDAEKNNLLTITDMDVVSGKFLLEAQYDKATEIFNGVK